jgi:DMSO/TMAO reductase YedYZ molybdopterin-dependent catalytic subunit
MEPRPAAGRGSITVHEMDPVINLDELQLAARNHGMPLEVLREPVTPVGLHYLLIHYDIPPVDIAAWRLELDGAVERRLTLSLDELRSLPAHEVVSTMECAGNGRARLEPHVVSQPWLLEAVGTGRWRGVRLRDVLERAGAGAGAVEVLFTALDRGVEGGEEQSYQRSLTLDDALHPDVLLAYDLNGAPLPPQHGSPLRLLVPGWYGMTNVKWLARITLLTEPFAGYQQARGYRLRQSEDDDGEPVARIVPRALMVPPGIPDFLTRERSARPGRIELAGRAWSGHGEIVSVEVSDDDGESWQTARLGPADLGPWAWRAWTFAWDARPGRHVLCCRARDATGREQPATPSWNLGGYANNAVQRVIVTVS